MGELLYGQDIATEQAAKLVKFLQRPGPPPGSRAAKDAPDDQRADRWHAPAGDATAERRPRRPCRRRPTREGPKEEPKKEAAKKDEPKKPYKPEIASDEFKARVREAAARDDVSAGVPVELTMSPAPTGQETVSTG